MVKMLLEEVRAAPLDEPSRERLAEIYERSVAELSDALSPDLQHELKMLALPFRDGVVPTEGEIRVAKAQLVGWLEGLFHGIQATLFAQQLAARQQLEQMRAASHPAPPAATPAASPANPSSPPKNAPVRISRSATDATRPELRHAGGGCARPPCESRDPVDPGAIVAVTSTNHIGVIHPPARPHRVLDVGRGGPARRAGGQGGGRRAAGDRDHRSRQHVRHAGVLQGVPGPGHQAGHRHRGLHGPRPPQRAPDPPWPRRRLGR